MALVWKIKGDRRCLDQAVAYLRALASWDSWGDDLVFGHHAHGYAVGLDWLWDDIEDSVREELCDGLHRHVQAFFETWASNRSGIAFAYLCNHHTVPLSGMMAAASVLYGERPGISPWLNMALEKTRGTVAALGQDGLSPEGVAYGLYFMQYALQTMLLIRNGLGVDLFADAMTWLREYCTGLVYHLLPRRHWSTSSTFMMFGDTEGPHWYGPDGICRICAAVCGDGYGQWLASAVDRDGVAVTQSGCLPALSVVDPGQAETPPDDLPLARHFRDLDLFLSRSGWNGDESVSGMICGPSMSYRGLQLYPNPFAGGHMHAFAGHFQVFAHGEYAIRPAGYARKRSEFFNILLVNGRGQLGEGGDWFEDLAFRSGHAHPTILCTGAGPGYAYVAGNCAPAYPDDLGVESYVRHFLHLHSDAWVLIDVVRTAEPGTCAVLLHSGVELTVCGGRVLEGQGERSTLRVSSLAPSPVSVSQEVQAVYRAGSGERYDAPMVAIQNAEPLREIVFVTVIQSAPGATETWPPVATEVADCVKVSIADRTFHIDPAGGLR